MVGEKENEEKKEGRLHWKDEWEQSKENGDILRARSRVLLETLGPLLSLK